METKAKKTFCSKLGKNKCNQHRFKGCVMSNKNCKPKQKKCCSYSEKVEKSEEFKHKDRLLIQASIDNDINRVKKLIKLGADVNYEDSEALVQSILSGNNDIMIILLQNGANPHLENRGGENALDSASSIDADFDPDIDIELDNLLEEYGYEDLFTMVQDLHDKYLMAVKMQKKYKRNSKKKKSAHNKKVLHKHMTPSQHTAHPKYSNLAQVAFTDPQIAKRITKHLPEDWSLKGGKKQRKNKH